MKKLPKEKCIGCGVCYLTCPFNAIEMVTNEEGFITPKIDTTKCKKCGLCEKKCPILKKQINENNKYKIYAAYTKNKKILKQSSSGGIFYELAQQIILSGGIVYGVAFNNVKYAHHIRIDKIKDIKKIMGSKYLQSNAYHVFEKIKEDLINNKKVLFSGTPCQVSSLKIFLNKDYENLITVDFICTGVPSTLVFKEYVSYLEKKYNDNFVSIDYRNKKNGWYNYLIKIKFENKTVFESRFFNPLMILHHTHLSIRKSCFTCPYRKGASASDIEIGDFWNIDLINKQMYNKYGVSVIIAKTKKGEKLFSQVKNNFIYAECSENDLLSTNKSYDNINMDIESRNIFFKELLNCESKYEVIKKYTKYKFSEKINILKNLFIIKIKNK